MRIQCGSGSGSETLPKGPYIRIVRKVPVLTNEDDGWLERSRHTEERAHQLLPLPHPLARQAAGADVNQVAPKKAQKNVGKLKKFITFIIDTKSKCDQDQFMS